MCIFCACVCVCVCVHVVGGRHLVHYSAHWIVNPQASGGSLISTSHLLIEALGLQTCVPLWPAFVWTLRI